MPREKAQAAKPLIKHLTTPGLDLRLALGRVRDDVLKSTGSRQEPFLYGTLGGSEISLVPGKAPPVSDSWSLRTNRSSASTSSTLSRRPEPMCPHL
jgi:hypothetical protein